MENRLDMKYELFLKWLQSNEMIGETQTDDEITSQVLTSDDEDDFVDTETDFPPISLREVTTTPEPDDCQASVYTKLLSAECANDWCSGESSGKATPTPSLLTVKSMSDYDSSTSDISGVSDNTKRKAKHNKGKAPPIPIPLSVQLLEENHDTDSDAPPVNEKSERPEKKSILNFLPGLFRSKSPARNQFEEGVAGNDDKCETQIWSFESVRAFVSFTLSIVVFASFCSDSKNRISFMISSGVVCAQLSPLISIALISLLYKMFRRTVITLTIMMTI